MPFAHSPGATTLLSNTAGTTTVVGDWFRIHPKLGRLSFHATLLASSIGATASSSVNIEVSNDGVYPLATKALTLSLTNTSTTYASDGGVLASTMDGTWQYVRANCASLTTSTAGSTGNPQVSVTMGAAWPHD